MASKKITLANEIAQHLINDVSIPSITSSNTVVCIGGVLNLELLNKNGLTLAVSPVSREPFATLDRCALTHEYMVAIALYKKLTTQDTIQYVNAASESEIDVIDELAEDIEDILYDTHFTNYTFKELDSDIQLDPEAFDHGFFKHGLLLRYVGG